jgi:DUF1365 family protein
VSASCLYLGAIRHRRFGTTLGGPPSATTSAADGTPSEQTFRHGIALALIDLDELPGLLGGRLVRRRPGLVRFRRRDYFGDRATPLREAIADEVERQTGRRPTGPIRLLTHLRSLGHCFNPVSFALCLDPAGEHVEHVLAEVTNTPWGERRAYVISRTGPDAPAVTGTSEKALHVSPFQDMDQRYSWEVSDPGAGLRIHIENHASAGKAFDATLSLRRQELTRGNLARVTARYPAATLRVLALIYAHAVGLKLRGAQVHPHPTAA